MSTGGIARETIEFMNRQHATECEALARDARSLAELLTTFADDVSTGLAAGKHNRIAQDTTQFLIRAATLRAKTETTQVFNDIQE